MKEYQGVKIVVCILNKNDIITASQAINFDVKWLGTEDEIE